MAVVKEYIAAGSALSLYFQLKEGKKADLEIVSAAAIAWVEAMRAVARAVDPNSDIKVELIDADKASLSFNTVIEWFERHVEPKLGRLERGAGRLPRTRKLAIALAVFIIFTGVPTAYFYFDDDSFTDEDREMLKEIHDKVLQDPSVESSKRKFFRTLEREPIIAAVGVKEDPDSAPLVMVSSEHFAEAGGLWALDEDTDALEVTHPVLDVILVKPALVHRPRSWTFKPEGLPEFDAVMRDPIVLAAMEKGLPLQFREGVPMTIRLEVKERREDGQLRLVRGGRSVVRVLSPQIT